MMCDDTCPNACGRCHRCAEEITRLRADISRYVSRDTERLAEVEKLREALKPFDAMGFFVNEDPDDRVVSMGRWVHGGKVNDEPFEVFYADLQLTVADIRRARAVLTGTEAPQEENVTEPLGEAHFSDPKPLG